MKGFKRVTEGFTVWEGVGEWTELQHIDPHSYGHNSVSFPFSWAAQPGAWFSLPHLISNFSIRGPGGLLCWLLVFSTALISNWLNFLCPELYNCSTPTLLPASVTNRTHSTRPQSKLYPDIPQLDAPVIYTGAFPILTAWPGSICYTTENFSAPLGARIDRKFKDYIIVSFFFSPTWY